MCFVEAQDKGRLRAGGSDIVVYVVASTPV